MLATKAQLQINRQQLAASFLRDLDANAYLADHSQLIDEILIHFYRQHLMEKPLTLLAVGGYGRAEMYPFSDIDIVLLRVEDIPDALIEESIGNFLQCLWDKGLQVGHAVRTLSECTQWAVEDASIQTALLEARYLIGQQDLFHQLQRDIASQCVLLEFIQTKIAEQRQRHQRYHNIESSLEPNCKESPGGLRDIHMLYWIHRVMQVAPNTSGLQQAVGMSFDAATGNHLKKTPEDIWSQWQAYGLLSPDESLDIVSSECFLRTLRIHLHLFCKRLNDKVLLNVQPDLAEAMAAYFVAPEITPHALRPSEKMMKRYYRHAMQVLTINQLLVDSLQEMIGKSEAQHLRMGRVVQHLPYGLVIRADQCLDFNDASVLQQQPEHMLKPFLLRYEHENIRDISPAIKRHIRSWCARLTTIREHTVLRLDFLKLLQLPEGTTTTLRMLNRMGFLGAYLPAFGRIVGQMQHDLYHAYTVDQHILMVIRHLRRLMLKAFEHEYPEHSGLMARHQKPWLLIVAALYHDIAKGAGGNHSVLGRDEVRVFCRDHQLSLEETKCVEWLVEDHLRMSRTAQHEDITDSKVIAAFAERVQTQERLEALYLLTVADIRGTGPTLWSLWKAKLLSDLYQTTHEFFLQQSHKNDQALIKESLYAQVVSILKKKRVDTDAFNRWWRDIHGDYMSAFDPEMIAWHFQESYQDNLNENDGVSAEDLSDVPKPMVAVRREYITDAMAQQGREWTEGNLWLQLIVSASYDHAGGLFGRVCGHLAHLHYSVRQARIIHWKADQTLLHFRLEPTRAGFTQKRIEALKTEMRYRLQQGGWPSPFKMRLSQHVRQSEFQPQIQWALDEYGRYVLSMVAVDRMGLLYDVARFFSDRKVVLHHARINTLGYRAENTFVIACEFLSKPRAAFQFKKSLEEVCTKQV